MNDKNAELLIKCINKFSLKSIFNEYYTDLFVSLEKNINVKDTKVHFIYAIKMGIKYLKCYKEYFQNPEIREFDMKHEQWLFGERKYTEQILNAIDEFMEIAPSGQ